MADAANGTLFAYDLTTGKRAARYDVALPSRNAHPVDLWGDGSVLWVADRTDGRAYAYDARGKRLLARELSPPSATRLRGLWSDGTTAWLVVADPAVRTAPLPGGSSGAMHAGGFAPSGEVRLESLELGGIELAFAPETRNYEVVVPAGVGRTTVTATPGRVAAVSIEPPDADPQAPGHQVDLPDGFTVVRVVVTRGVWTGTYEVVLHAGEAPPLTAAFEPEAIAERESATFTVRIDGDVRFDEEREIELETSGSAGTGDHSLPRTLKLRAGSGQASAAVQAKDDRVAEDGETLTVVARLSALASAPASLDIAASGAPPDIVTSGNNNAGGVWSDGDTIWVGLNGYNGKIFAYGLRDGARRAHRDLPLPTGFYVQGLWSNGETLWVAAWDKKRLFAFALADGSRLAARDIGLGWYGGFGGRGLWGDGEFVFVVGRESGAGNMVRAYRLADGGAALGEGPRAAGRHVGMAARGVGRRRTAVGRQRTRDRRAPIRDFGRARRVGRVEARPWQRAGDRLAGVDVAGNQAQSGMWSDGETMWIADQHDDRLYAYPLPAVSSNATLTLLRLEGADLGAFSPRRTEYVGDVPAATAAATLVAFPAAGAELEIDAPDADLETDGPPGRAGGRPDQDRDRRHGGGRRDHADLRGDGGPPRRRDGHGGGGPGAGDRGRGGGVHGDAGRAGARSADRGGGTWPRTARC